jgi:FKBP-type peptidyl-prolyl cis-trans isomerase SlyD
LQARTSDGGLLPITVVELDENTVKIDANHPLAGIPLTFDVTIKELRNATVEELTHGHIHGPGGH